MNNVVVTLVLQNKSKQILNNQVRVYDEATKRLSDLRPYIEKLRQAEARGLELDMVEQAGFQELFALERGESTTALCPICYEGVGANGQAPELFYYPSQCTSITVVSPHGSMKAIALTAW